MVRDLDAFEGFDGYYSTHETSVLLGYRSPGRHLYRTMALGVANAAWKDGHGSCAYVPCTFRDEGRGLAYDIGLHATRMLGGVSANISGVIASERLRIFALVFSLEAGWFGK